MVHAGQGEIRQNKTRQDTGSTVIDPDSVGIRIGSADPEATRSTDLEVLGGLVDGAKLFTTHRALADPFTPLFSSLCII